MALVHYYLPHEAFEYFTSIQFSDELKWRTGKVQLNNDSSEAANVAQKVRILIKIYKNGNQVRTLMNFLHEWQDVKI